MILASCAVEGVGEGGLVNLTIHRWWNVDGSRSTSKSALLENQEMEMEMEIKDVRYRWRLINVTVCK